MTNCCAVGFRFTVVKLAFMSMTVQLDLLVTKLLCQRSNEVKVLKMAKNFTSLQVKVLELFFTSLHAKSNRKLLK